MLWVKEGPRRGKFYPIRHGTKIGRRDGNLILDHHLVSGSHAKFTMEDGNFFIWDLGSTNGTFVNGRRIRKAILLEENDVIKIGDTFFVVKLLESKPKRKTSRVNQEKAGTKSKKAGA
jgi:pSer/pThr/pTyr-binding forkhead associated (FHA) protein